MLLCEAICNGKQTGYINLYKVIKKGQHYIYLWNIRRRKVILLYCLIKSYWIYFKYFKEAKIEKQSNSKSIYVTLLKKFGSHKVSG